MLNPTKSRKFIDKKLAEEVANLVFSVLGPDFKRLAKRYSINVTDIIRFYPVSQRCRTKREKKGLSFKQISSALNIPQYRLKAIESTSVRDINVDVLERYIDFLELNSWFAYWKRKNQDLYHRISLKKPQKAT